MNFEPLKQFMHHVTDTLVPGNSVAVYRDGEPVFSYATGYADKEAGIPMQGDELLHIYSCSKVATVTAALQLFERGQYRLTDPIGAYMPAFAQMTVQTEHGIEKAKNPIRILDLFRMTAGFSYNMKTPAFSRAKERTAGNMDTLTVLSCLAEEPLCFEPGAHWQYSLCHDVLAGLVETVSGVRFADYVKEHIFDPLGMASATYHAQTGVAPQYICRAGGDTDDIVKLQQAGGRGLVVRQDGNSHILGPRYDSGGAGIAVTVPDYVKLAAALACGGRAANGERILHPETVDLMATDSLTPTQKADFNWPHCRGYTYGLGVKVLLDPKAAESRSPHGEFSWGGAAGATVLMDRENRLAMFYAHHMLNPQEVYYQPRLRNCLYNCTV